MCIILLALEPHPQYRLVIAANRDEAYARPTRTAHFWEDDPQIYGGRDLEQGGSWLALRRDGRIAAVTNFRDHRAPKTAPRSRGELVREFLRGDAPSAEYLAGVRARAAQYNGFSLIVGDGSALWYYSNRGGEPAQIAPGVHGISNNLLDTPWPKVVESKKALGGLLDVHGAALIDRLFAILADREIAPDHTLPDTGVGIQRERELSSVFIPGVRYGTRASTVVLIGRDDGAVFIERSFGPQGVQKGEVSARFAIASAGRASSRSAECPLR